MAELIAASGDAAHLADWKLLRLQLSNVARDSFDGSINKMAGKLNVGKHLLYAQTAASITSLMELCCRLKVRPLELLQGKAKVSPDAIEPYAAYRRYQRSKEETLTVLRAKLSIELQNLALLQNKMIVLADVARKLGVPLAILNRHFPEAIRAMKEHNERSRAVVVAEKQEQRLTAARRAMQDLVKRGDPAIARCIRAALREHGICWRTAETDSAAHAELVRLGVVRKARQPVCPDRTR